MKQDDVPGPRAISGSSPEERQIPVWHEAWELESAKLHPETEAYLKRLAAELAPGDEKPDVSHAALGELAAPR